MDVEGRVALRAVYVRGLGLVHLVAIGSLWVQLEALIGERGILPVAPALRAGNPRWLEAPTLLWWWPDGMHALSAAGVALAVALVAGLPFEGPALLGLWAIYLSLCTAGQVFLHFQWDGLLLEATLAATLVARWHPRPSTPPRWAWWLQWWLAFRLMFFGGLVKLTSGDPTWRDLTALDFHFFTQPLPNPISRWVHHWPAWLHAAGVVVTFVVELALPFAIPFGRRARLAVFAGCSALMGMLALTGNYGFFQLLSVVVLLTLLDDGFLPRWVRDRVARPVRDAWPVGWPVAAGMVALSFGWIVGYERLPRWGQRALEVAAPFRSVNPYGLFAVMTTERPEVQLEGSWDGGATWRELDLRYKPGSDLARVPPQVAPHMPRVDWQLWFAALGDCRRNAWVVHLMRRVVEGGPVEDLFREGTFADGPPGHVRAVLYRYAFGTGSVWVRQRVGPYCPTVERRSPGTPGAETL